MPTPSWATALQREDFVLREVRVLPWMEQVSRLPTELSLVHRDQGPDFNPVMSVTNVLIRDERTTHVWLPCNVSVEQWPVSPGL